MCLIQLLSNAVHNTPYLKNLFIQKKSVWRTLTRNILNYHTLRYFVSNWELSCSCTVPPSMVVAELYPANNLKCYNYHRTCSVKDHLPVWNITDINNITKKTENCVRILKIQTSFVPAVHIFPWLPCGEKEKEYTLRMSSKNNIF